MCNVEHEFSKGSNHEALFESCRAQPLYLTTLEDAFRLHLRAFWLSHLSPVYRLSRPCYARRALCSIHRGSLALALPYRSSVLVPLLSFWVLFDALILSVQLLPPWRWSCFSASLSLCPWAYSSVLISVISRFVWIAPSNFCELTLSSHPFKRLYLVCPPHWLSRFTKFDLWQL